MKTYLLAILFLLGNNLFSQQKISGKTLSENNMIVSSVLIINVTNNQKAYSNSVGEFTIAGSVNDELRFAKSGYERLVKRIVNTEDFQNAVLIRIPEEIEEVEIVSLTGNLNKDSKKLTKVDKAAQLQKDIGLPRPPEIARERAPELKDAFAIGFPVAAINIDALYKVISGDARRMKSLYKFEDMQRHINWIVMRVDTDYFESLGITKNRIKEFLEFSFLENRRSLDFVKAKNINGALFEIEKSVPEFMKRIDTTKNTKT